MYPFPIFSPYTASACLLLCTTIIFIYSSLVIFPYYSSNLLFHKYLVGVLIYQFIVHLVIRAMAMSVTLLNCNERISFYSDHFTSIRVQFTKLAPGSATPRIEWLKSFSSLAELTFFFSQPEKFPSGDTSIIYTTLSRQCILLTAILDEISVGTANIDSVADPVELIIFLVRQR